MRRVDRRRDQWPVVALLAICGGCAAPSATQERGAALPSCAEDGAEPIEFARAPSGALEVDATWLAAHRCQVRVVDVRSRAELEGELGRIAEAQWAPLEVLEASAATWESHEPIVIVDRSGRRAVRAQEALRALGMHRVASMTGGMLAWRAAGLPVITAALAAPPAALTVAGRRAAIVDPVRVRLSDASAIQWVTLASIVGAGAEQCVDGRADGPIVGTPGGDAGELILALAALEQSVRAQVPDSALAGAVTAYVEGFGRFYLHSDEAALSRLAATLAADSRFAGALEDGDVVGLVRRPPAALEDALVEQLVRPEHVGCGHLRLMLEHPSEYGVRRALVVGALRESFRLGWRHPELLDFEVLAGDHEERAVVQVRLDAPIHTYTRVPTFPARAGDDVAFFVAHPEVSAFLRSELGSFLIEHAPVTGLRAPEPEPFARALDALAERQIEATMRHLARELPVYEVRVDDGVPHVTGPSPPLGSRDD